MLNIFIGYDDRQPVAYNILQQSLFRHATQPLRITPLILHQLPLKRQGLTPFTFSRFLVPYLCNYQGWALFLDIDMLATHDIAELFALADEQYAVMVVKHKQKFEWASLMLLNCAKCQVLTPDYIETAQGLHSIDWVPPEQVGTLPHEWNHLVGYDRPRDDAKLVHYTQGVPAFPETQHCEYAKQWHKEHQLTNSTMPWQALMGNSVHAAMVEGKLVPKLAVKPFEE